MLNKPSCYRYLAVISQCFPVFSQQTKERVKLLIQLADGFCEKGHAHAAEIKKCVTAVDKRYRDFSLRMEKYRTCLEKALGISSDSNKSVGEISAYASGRTSSTLQLIAWAIAFSVFLPASFLLFFFNTEQKPAAGYNPSQCSWIRGEITRCCS